jgi:ariadne-1
LSDQEDDALEEYVLQVLEDEHHEDCHWSSSSVRALL